MQEKLENIISQEAFIGPCHYHIEEKLTNLIIQVYKSKKPILRCKQSPTSSRNYTFSQLKYYSPTIADTMNYLTRIQCKLSDSIGGINEDIN